MICKSYLSILFVILTSLLLFTAKTSGATWTTEVVDNSIGKSGWEMSIADGEFCCTTRTQKLADVNDWLYQLANADLDAIGKSRFDLVVIDAFDDEHIQRSRNDIEKLKCSSGGNKFVISYVSIGQAEDYRYYWKPAWKIGNPTWIHSLDPDWAGNYWVRFWDKEWQNIIFGTVGSYIDRVIDAGFDGVYLDRIDVYKLFESETTALDDIAEFIKSLSDYAREKSGNPDFIVIVQNAEELIVDFGLDWVKPITGIGKEELYIRAHDNPVTADNRQTTENFLDIFLAQGKMVLTVDYALEKVNIDAAYALTKAKGYIGFVTHNELGTLTINPGHEPD